MAPAREHVGLATRRPAAYLTGMDGATNLQGDSPDRPETAEARRQRLAYETVAIAEARAELDAGLYVDSDEIDVWIDSIGTANELPPPRTRHR